MTLPSNLKIGALLNVTYHSLETSAISVSVSATFREYHRRVEVHYPCLTSAHVRRTHSVTPDTRRTSAGQLKRFDAPTSIAYHCFDTKCRMNTIRGVLDVLSSFTTDAGGVIGERQCPRIPHEPCRCACWYWTTPTVREGARCIDLRVI